MRKILLILSTSCLLLGLFACTKQSTENSNAIDAEELPTIDLVATHDVNLDVSVAQLTFVPNSVAPWLGRIILLNDDGHLYSTDIEGRDPKSVSTGKYIDIFGLAREAAPGVFLAITDDNRIEAFIESDDDGNFSPMIYSGKDVKAKTLCKSFTPATDVLSIIDNRESNILLAMKINDNSIEQEIIETWPGMQIAATCSFSKELYEGYDYYKHPEGYDLIIQNVPKPEQAYAVDIKNGLSVRGIEQIKYVAYTRSNYGGGAYADGVLALVDKDENRIVFISLSYAERQLLKAINPPDNTSQ